jgi:tetratricopeptide (TPR) repeat protein
VSLLLDLSEADAEGGSFNGGFDSKADELYTQVLKQTESGADDIGSCVRSLLKAHCLNGLARLALLGKQIESTRGPVVAQNLAEKALTEANSVRSTASIPIFLWNAASASASSALFHLNVSRQLVADSLVRASRPSDAQSFLEDAVRDNPSDFDAAFALGAFRLRMALYESDTASTDAAKTAQTQLLKSARIDSGKADPFALLGIWYEVQKDVKRALGCYSKALLLDPSNPSAGRGVLRLKSSTEMQIICETATNSNSPVNGWAWRAIGQHKAMVENDDELAIICFHKALRCRDIECSQNESLSVFFAPPPGDNSGLTTEFADVWAELAGCYRRVGRYAAAVRAFNSAWQADGDKLSSNVLCLWAQGKHPLGTKNLRDFSECSDSLTSNILLSSSRA